MQIGLSPLVRPTARIAFGDLMAAACCLYVAVFPNGIFASDDQARF